MSRRALLAVCVYAGVTLATGYLGQAQVRDPAPVTDAMLQAPDPADWPSWRRTLDGWGYSPLDEIDRSNVDELRLVWSWGFEPGVSQTTPIVHDGFLYVANPGNVVQALDARTGDFVWEYRREMDERLRSTAQMRSLAVYQDLVILNTYDAHIVGLDVRTGEARWDTPVGGEQEGYTFSSGPIVVDGTIVAGMTGCGRYRDDTCYIVGVDGRTATILPGDPLPEERNPRGGSGVFVFALPAPQSPDLPGIVRVTIEVELSCPSCAAGLERRLRRLDDVAGVEVNPADGQIVLAVEPGRHPDPAAVWDTVRNAGFIPDRMAIAAIGHVIDGNGAPALALSPDFALPLVEMDGLMATATAAGDQLVKVTGHWHAAPGGAGRLQVESFEVRQ